MQFANVIGQEAIKNYLLKNAQHGHISHAQLFLGAEGSGNLALALAYAQYLNCTNKQPADSCGHCNSCQMSVKLAHPDIHFSYPTVTTGNKGKKSTDYIAEWRQAVLQNPYMNVFDWLQFIKAENKQGNITAEECDEIVRKLNLTSFQGAYKILIIWMPEYLGKEGNKLLKVIEEPPAGTLFLLVAENADAVLSTIISRTQLLRIPPLNPPDIEKNLLNRFQLSHQTARQIAALCNGNYNAALRLMNNTNVNNRQMLTGWLNACLQNNVPQFALFTEEIAETGREIQKNFIGYCLHFFTECLRLSMLPNYVPLLEKDEIQTANRLLQSLNFNSLEELVQAFEKADEHITRNANSRIVFFNLSVRLSAIGQGKISYT
ncbi:hypothetical protein C7N43_08960 [Sphingobacteriales bacterium UPWRP_1]|nr:hypothetical protein B6N25_08625 [Sphingobacteriales bacterium TSM_CSS]PSJ77355.1 hypothetical protein C7N43_08960 [Sphingobacteriales bacterium UPWRP_1]